MVKNFIFAFFLLSFLIGTPVVFAEEFYVEYFDGNRYPHQYEIKNGTITNFESFTNAQSIIFDTNGVNGKLIIIIPKTIPFDLTNQKYGDVLFTLNNGEEVRNDFVELTCNYRVTVEFDGQSQIELLVPTILSEPRITYMELRDSCLDDPKYNTVIQQKLKEKDCIDNTYERGFNIRDEVVCIFPDSYPLLYERGYLKTYSIIK